MEARAKICRSNRPVRQTSGVVRALIVSITLTGGAVLAVACSSSDIPSTCADLSARILELETRPASADQSWDSVEAMAERSIERDALRAEMARQGCK
jgi:hypothetical protein